MPPQMLPQFSHSSLNRPPNGNLNVLRTPSVATRKRKRAHQYTVSYSEVQEVDSAGRVRDVIVIEDTPPPSTVSPSTTHTHLYSASYQPPVYSAPIRTRARAAAEAQALSASTSSAATAVAKKRKRDPADDAGTVAKRAANGHLAHAVAVHKSYASGSGAATDDVSFTGLIHSQVASADTSSHSRRRSKSPATTKKAITSSLPTTLSTDVVSYPYPRRRVLSHRSSIQTVLSDFLVKGPSEK